MEKGYSASTGGCEQGFWTAKEVSFPFFHTNTANDQIFSNLSSKYCSVSLLVSLSGMQLFNFFCTLICWYGCHSWFRSQIKFIKLGTTCGWSYKHGEWWWWFERVISNFIRYSLDVFCFHLIVGLTLKVCNFLLFSLDAFLLVFSCYLRCRTVYTYMYMIYVCVIIMTNFYIITIKLLNINPPCGYLSFKL